MFTRNGVDSERELLDRLKTLGVTKVHWSCYEYSDEYEFFGEPEIFVGAEDVSCTGEFLNLNLFDLQDIAYATYGDFTGSFDLNPQTGEIQRTGDVYLPEPEVEFSPIPDELIEVKKVFTRKEAGR